MDARLAMPKSPPAKLVEATPAAGSGISRLLLRRLVPAVVVAALFAAVAPASAPVAAAQAPTEAEAHVLSLVNAARQSAGRVPLRWDSRLADVAQTRSDDMASTGNFGHVGWNQLTGMIAHEGVTWYYLGEVLVMGTPLAPMDSAREAVDTWRGSSAHWDMLMGTDFNYVAFGAARASSGWWFWTGLLIKGPDRTAPSARINNFALGAVASGQRSFTLSWSGADVPLQVLTAGLRDFRVQRRVGAGLWVAVTDWTRSTSRTFTLTVGKTYQFRVRSRDNAGNRSTWTVAVTVTP